jgi:hypothetical protein
MCTIFTQEFVTYKFYPKKNNGLDLFGSDFVMSKADSSKATIKSKYYIEQAESSK